MADVTVAADEKSSGPVSLSANAAKSVQFGRDLSEIDVANVGGTDVVWVAISSAAQLTAATVSGKHCWPVYANTSAVLPVRADGNTYVSVISSAATTAYVNAT